MHVFIGISNGSVSHNARFILILSCFVYIKSYWLIHVFYLPIFVITWALGKIKITVRPRQNGRRFPDDILKCILLNQNVWIPIKISLRFVRWCPINNIPSLVQILIWRRPGAKPLAEPMMVSLPTHICVTGPRWVKIDRCQSSGPFTNMVRSTNSKCCNPVGKFEEKLAYTIFH